MDNGYVWCVAISFFVFIVCALIGSLNLTKKIKRGLHWGAICGLAIFVLGIFAGCQQEDTASPKSLDAKLKAMAPETHQDKMQLDRFAKYKVAAPTVTTMDLTGATLAATLPPDAKTGTTFVINGKLASGTLTTTTPAPVPPAPFPGAPANVTDSGILTGNTVIGLADGTSTKAWPWKWNHDAGTPGSSTGTFTWPITGNTSSNPASDLSATQTGKAGEIWHLSFGTDVNATHFVYDAEVLLSDPTQVANVEMDMNQVLANGNTVILATQCASGSGTWEYTIVSGGTHWHASNIPCNPKKWAANTWHHIQIATERDAAGNVTYDWVIVDGVQSNFLNAKGPSSEALGWAKVLLLNFQLDGANASGKMEAKIANLHIWRW